MAPRRVVYVVVDGLSTTAFEQAIASGRAPAFAFLRDRSRYVRDSVAIFPTITPCASASLVTGEVPARHGIPGMCWYDRNAQRFVNYGQSPRAALVEGVAQIVEDVVVNLNCAHLSPEVQTIHEQLHDLGLVTAAINFMIFRGPFSHEIDLGILQKILFGKHLPETIPGPKEHYFAGLVRGSVDPSEDDMDTSALDRRLRVTDRWAASVTRELLERDLADMILFYLHENDHLSHRAGPSSQVENLARADEQLAYVLDTFPSWEEALEEVGFVVTSDHSQSPISEEPDHILDLSELLTGFSQVRPGKGAEPLEDSDLAAAGNGRVAFVYLNESRRKKLLEAVVRQLLEHPGVDQVMWRDDGQYRIASGRGTLVFSRADGNGAVVDERGNKWQLSGDLEPVGGVVEEDEIRTPEYPLALWRISTALDLDRIGDIVVTPKLTYEFQDLAGADHRGGGDHASLHAQDSLIPFMSTLTDPPLHPAATDVVPHIVGYLRRVH